ncbi:hypothetical protein ACKKBF_B10635 [Auxenochlorella protothecoides x Auxenochlorella symbiontica]
MAANEGALPSAWDSNRRSSNSRFLQVTDLRVKYIGTGNDDRDAAAIRSNYPVSKSLPFYYWEAQIVDKGRDGFIGVGMSAADVKLERLPGWEPRSYGYHGDDGNIFNGRGYGQKYGPTFTTGDVIGVLFDRVERTISFTKNGRDLGVAFQHVMEPVLYPTIGFRTPDEEVVANFGGQPFQADASLFHRQAVARLHDEIRGQSLDKISKTPGNVVGRLVFNYCTHHGLWDTASLVARDVLAGAVAVSEAQRAEQAGLRRLAAHVRAGDVDAALEESEALGPGVLAARPGIRFRLLAQKLAELIGAGRDVEAMEFGRAVVDPAASTAEDHELLEDVVALFAYTDPASSPSGRLLTDEHRAELAAALVRALLAQSGKREFSALEVLHAHARALHAQLVAAGDPCTAMIPSVERFVAARGTPLEQEEDGDGDTAMPPA